MSTPNFPDPFQLWRDALTKFETNINAQAGDTVKSTELVRTMQQASTVAFGMNQAFEKAIEDYLRRRHLPSRGQLLELSDTLQRIEEKIDRLIPAQRPLARPARTRRPPPRADEADTAAEPAKAPARTRRAAGGADSGKAGATRTASASDASSARADSTASAATTPAKAPKKAPARRKAAAARSSTDKKA